MIEYYITRAYPKPFTDKLKIELGERSFTELRLIDKNGQIISTENIDNKNGVVLDLPYSVVPAGKYYLRLSGKTKNKIIEVIRE